MSNLVAQSRTGRERAMPIAEGTFIGNVSGFINANETSLPSELTPEFVLSLQSMNQFLLNNKVFSSDVM
jgi:hypothetical protein